MGEPVEVVEGSDSEISRLFPKCRPRLTLPPTFNSEINTPQGTISSSDVNRNCVSDANDNYEVLPSAIEDDVTSQRDDSSGGSSRMSVDSACATTSSTPASHSSSSSHTTYSGGNFPANDKSNERSNAENENDDLSVVSAYLDERFSSTVLDSSYEDSVGGQGVSSPSITSHKHVVSNVLAHGTMQSDARVSPQPMPLLRREHFRLRDSRIETAGGKEMFSQSRSRSARKRHEESRRVHHNPHHYNHQPLIHHSHHHHHHHSMQHQKQPQQHISQLAGDYIRKVESSSSRSNSTNSNSSSSSERRSSESKSESKDAQEEEGGHSGGSEGAGSASTLVYETRLSGSSEVVFDDISEWVERGLTVRGVENSTARRVKRGSNGEQHFIATPVTPPTPPSQSDHDSEYDDVDDEDEDSPMRVTRIGSVQIAEYEGSPRRYGQPQRPPRPGFPRRVNNGPQDERTRALINSLEADKKNSEMAVQRTEKSHLHMKSSDLKKSKLRQNQQELPEIEPPRSPPSLEKNPKGKDNLQTYSVKSENDVADKEEKSEESEDAVSPVKISISTLTSSYGSSLSQIPPPPPPPSLEHQAMSESVPVPEIYEDYGFEDSETRKVLEEFFLDSRGGKQPEFYDLEYTLKRQHGNSYVGQRLATAECEESGEQHCDGGFHQEKEEQNQEECETNNLQAPPENPHQDSGTEEMKRNNNNKHSENLLPSVTQENGNAQQENSEVSRVSSTCSQLHEQQIPLTKPHSFNQQHSPASVSNENSTSSPSILDNVSVTKLEESERNSSTHSSRRASPLIDLNVIADLPGDESLSCLHKRGFASFDAGEASNEENIENRLAVYDEKNNIDLLNSFEKECLSRDEQAQEIDIYNAQNEPTKDGEISRVLPGFSDILEDVSSFPLHEIDFNEHQTNLEIGISRNFTLSPETTSCDSLDVESEFSVGEGEGSIPSSGKVVSTMPVLEDGLSSGEESEMEIVNTDQRIFPSDDQQAVLMRQQLFLDQHHHLYHQPAALQVYQEDKNGELVDNELERERVFQRARSLDNQLCRGELPPLTSSVSVLSQHPSFNTSSLTVSALSQSNVASYSNSPSSPFLENSLPHATSSPHAKSSHGKPPHTHPSHSPHTSLSTHSPSTSTLTLMKKQISEIEREIALKKPEGVNARKAAGEGESLPPNLDLHLLDPLNKKVGEPPPPPAPHPHRGNNNSLENGSPQSTPPHTSSASTSPSRVIGHLHSPQFTPVSVPVVGPQLLSSLGSLTSPGQVSPHMVPGHPATLDLQHKPGNGVSPSRESVEAAIADIKQAIRRTKNLPLKTHPQEKQDRGPVWIPRNSRRDLPYTKKHSSPSSTQTQENSPQLQQHESSPSGGSNKSQDRSLHEEEDGDTDQETDRLLGQQRSDDGFLEEKNWSRIRSKPVMPMSMAPNHKEADSEGGGLNSNDSTPSTPSHHGSANLTPSSPQDLLSSNKFIGKKEKEYGKKKGRSKEVMVHEPAVLIEGVLFRARYLGSTQLVSEGQPTKTTRMMQAEEAVSRIKAPEGEVQPSTEVDLFISTEKIMVLNTDLKEIMMDHALRTISYIADIGDLVVLMARRRVLPTDEQTDNPSHRIPKMICHVFESDEAQFIAQSIGQAFQVAYLEFLKANGIEDHSFVKEMDYQEVLNSQEIFGDELQMFAKKELQKEVVVPKMKGEILGVVVVESGWGSMVPTVVIANLSPAGAAAKCGQLNIGDQIIAINGISLVGLPLSNCQNYIKNTKYNTAVKLTVVPCPPVVEVKIRRPDTKYQLGFSVQNGVICSLLRGGIAERGGVRVGHRIIDINSQSVVAVPHEKIVNLLATSIGEIRMKTMPTSIFRLLTGQETPQYI